MTPEQAAYEAWRKEHVEVYGKSDPGEWKDLFDIHRDSWNRIAQAAIDARDAEARRRPDHDPEEQLECSVCDWRGTEKQTTQRDFVDEPYGWACPICGEPCGHLPMAEWENAGEA